MMKKKNIVQINAVYGVGSTGKILKQLDENLENYGFNNTIVFSEGQLSNKHFQMSNALDKKIHALFSRITGLQSYFSRRETKKMLAYLSLIEPDVIHIHNIHSNFINLPLLMNYIIKNKIALVITLHDCWFYTGNRTHYTIDRCFNWIDLEIESSKGRCLKSKSQTKSWFFDRYKKILKDRKKWFSQIDNLQVVGVSDWITSEAKKSYVFNNEKVTRIYNWVDLSVFYPRDSTDHSFHFNQSRIILGVSTKWNDTKGLYKFIDLASHLDKNELIILVGKVERNLTLPDNIVCMDHIKCEKTLASIYSRADVFVNFSLEESFGKVTAEALACGTPVVVMNTTANPELVGRGCGFVSKNNSVDDVYKCIQKILKGNKKCFRRDCMNFAKKEFNMDNLIKDHVNLYDELICEKYGGQEK